MSLSQQMEFGSGRLYPVFDLNGQNSYAPALTARGGRRDSGYGRQNIRVGQNDPNAIARRSRCKNLCHEARQPESPCGLRNSLTGPAITEDGVLSHMRAVLATGQGHRVLIPKKHTKCARGRFGVPRPHAAGEGTRQNPRLSYSVAARPHGVGAPCWYLLVFPCLPTPPRVRGQA